MKQTYSVSGHKQTRFEFQTQTYFVSHKDISSQIIAHLKLLPIDETQLLNFLVVDKIYHLEELSNYPLFRDSISSNISSGSGSFINILSILLFDPTFFKYESSKSAFSFLFIRA